MKCDNKAYYKTKQIAKSRKREAETKIGKKLRIYKCPDCWGYHFTSTDIETQQYFRNLKYKKDE